MLITADQNILYQQNNRRRVIALIVLGTNRRKLLELKPDLIRDAVDRRRPYSYEFVLFEPPAT